LASLATLATWLAGLAVRLANLASRFQVNTVKVVSGNPIIPSWRRGLKLNFTLSGKPTENGTQHRPMEDWQTSF